MTLGNLVVSLGVNVAAFESGMRRAEARLNGFAAKVGGIGDRMEAAGGDLALRISAPLAGLGIMAVRAAGDMESLRKALESVAGSSELAEEQLARLKEIAKAPGIDFKEAVRGSVALQSVGIEAEVAEKALEGVARAVARGGGNSENFAGVLRQLQQVAGNSRIMGEELSVILENAPAIAPALQAAFGTTTAATIRDMGLTTDEFFERLNKGLATLPAVEGGLGNALANVGSAAQQALATVGDALNRLFGIQAKAEAFSALIERAADGFRAFTEANPVLAKLAASLALAAAAAGPLLVALGSVARVAGMLTSGLALVATPAGAIAAALLAVGAAAVYVYNNWSDLAGSVPALTTLARGFGDAWRIAADVLTAVWAEIVPAVTGGAGEVRSVVESFVNDAGALWERHGDAVLRVFRVTFEHVGRVFVAAINTLRGVVDVVGGLLAGDWGRVLEGLRRVTYAVMRSVVGLVSSALSLVSQATAEFVRAQSTALASFLAELPGAGPALAGAFSVAGNAAGAMFDRASGALDAFRSRADAVLGGIAARGGVVLPEVLVTAARRAAGGAPGGGAGGTRPAAGPGSDADRASAAAADRVADRRLEAAEKIKEAARRTEEALLTERAFLDRMARERATSDLASSAKGATLDLERGIVPLVGALDVVVARLTMAQEAAALFTVTLYDGLTHVAGEAFRGVGDGLAHVFVALGDMDKVTKNLGEAVTGFGDAVKHAMADVVASIGAAITKMLVLRGLTFAFKAVGIGTTGGLGGLILGALGGSAAASAAVGGGPASVSVSAGEFRVRGGDLLATLTAAALEADARGERTVLTPLVRGSR